MKHSTPHCTSWIASNVLQMYLLYTRLNSKDFCERLFLSICLLFISPIQETFLTLTNVLSITFTILWGYLADDKLMKGTCLIFQEKGLIKPGLRFSWFCAFFVSKGNPFWLLFYSTVASVMTCFGPYIIIAQVIFYFLQDHWAHPGYMYFENRILLKPELGGGGWSGGRGVCTLAN